MLTVSDLLVSADCDTIIVNTPNELALTIVQFTKAIAEQPYKYILFSITMLLVVFIYLMYLFGFLNPILCFVLIEKI